MRFYFMENIVVHIISQSLGSQWYLPLKVRMQWWNFDNL